MPKGIDWINFVYINLAFLALTLSMYFFASIADIKKDWPKYRCNPMFMPLSDNIQTDFTYCVQNMQNSYMGYLLEPLTYITSNLSSMATEFTDSLNFFRVMISNIRTFLESITGNIFGVFLNLITEFQKITISIKDLIGKLIGILISFMYIMDTNMKSMESINNGPIGQTVRGLCFHPDTKVKLNNNTIVLMKDLNLGDILESGSRVNAIIRLDNTEAKQELYIIPNGVEGKDIYVTGSHLIFSKETNKYIEVSKHPISKKQKENEKVETDWFSCLITSDHVIKLGDHHFYDWDDDLVRPL
jgi:hypothetical protein